MSTTLYPPVPAPTTDQEFLIAAGVKVRKSQYGTLDFSPGFQSIYGRPCITYAPWARLWSIDVTHILEAISPRYPSSSSNFLGFATYKDRYIEFCMEVDHHYGRLGGNGKSQGKVEDGKGKEKEKEKGEQVRPIGRTEMEGAWVKCLIGMFEEMRSKRDIMRGFVGLKARNGNGGLMMTIRDVEGEMREALKTAMEQRFGKEAEEYWARKWKVYGYRCPDLDVKCVTDWSIERPFQKSLLKPEDTNDNDYVETDDENENENETEDSGVAMNASRGIQTKESMQPSKQESKPEPPQALYQNSAQELTQHSTFSSK